MYILGISCYYHDSSATLLKDGIIISAVEEERFTRKKHDSSFPINAINYCLKNEQISIKNIDYIGFYEKPLLKFERILSQHLETFPRSLKIFLSSMPSWIGKKLRVIQTIRSKLKYKKGIIFIQHHMAHAAGSFLVSPFENAAILGGQNILNNVDIIMTEYGNIFDERSETNFNHIQYLFKNYYGFVTEYNSEILQFPLKNNDLINNYEDFLNIYKKKYHNYVQVNIFFIKKELV